ncbi:type IVB secretion system protein IcmH/DotU [Aggregatibacter kilianii]|jgi:type IV / VI secretion system protein, dotU family|uniref:type IVB secretion system protein IcmH/DotU n=1 Tax=Aggregatibacter kilianii TaxID=2025884 RepID=UPI0028D7E3FD|nr:type IVB secretion system protein IcmH/DotU [Aggregatibacter kilianii]
MTDLTFDRTNIDDTVVMSPSYNLALRGYNLNPMVDAATPLLGMVLRLKDVTDQDMPSMLYGQVVQDIQSLEQLLREHHYEPGMIVSFRYVLCTFIDEIALGHGWGAKSSWFQKSLLTYFHNETWGGEKVYILLDKLMAESKRYLDLLEFIYVCFCLGFRGRYKVTAQHVEEFESIFRKLHDVILNSSEKRAENIICYQENDEKKHTYKLLNKITLRKIFGIGVFVLIAIYCIYLIKLNSQTQTIIEQLNNLLH